MKAIWRNIPVPEVQVYPLLLGFVLNFLFERPLFSRETAATIAGVLSLCMGIGLIAWSVRAARRVQLENPAALVTSGPYAHSRNPMYVGWSLIFLGLVGLINSLWMAFLFPVALAMTHVVILREERDLVARFGDQYTDYARRVRRYL